MARNTLKIRKKMSLGEVYSISKCVATDYANTVQTHARSRLMERYDLTESAYYTMLELAVTHHLVDDKTVEKMRKKTKENQKAHGNHGTASDRKYDRFLEKRKKYSAFTKKDIAYIATFYATHPERSKEEVSKIFYFTSIRVLDKILLRACVEMIIPDKTFEQLRERAVRNATDIEVTEHFFVQLEGIREEAKSRKKNV